MFRNVYPIYLDQYPNPINFYGSLIMGSPRLAVCKSSFDTALSDANSSYEEKNQVFNTKLAKLCQSTWEMYKEEWLSCAGSNGSWDEVVQFRYLDWESQTKKRSEPKWYRKLKTKAGDDFPTKMTVSNRIVPQMLKLTLDGNPLVYHNGGQGSVISGDFVLMQNPLNASAKVATVLAKPFVSMIEKGRIKSTSEEGQALLDYWLDTVRETVRIS